MDHFGSSVLVLSFTGEGDRESFATGAGFHQVDGRVLHGEFRSEVAVDPFHQSIAVDHCPFGDEVVNVVGPVLDRGVPAASTSFDHDFDHCRMQAFAGIGWSSAAFDVMHAGAFVDDNQRPFELAHVFGVDPEVGLQGEFDVDSRRDVDERPTGPDGRVECRELVVGGWDDGAEVLAEQLGVFSQCRVGVGEDHALLGEVFLQAAVDDFRFVLSLHPGQVLLFGFGNPQSIVGLTNVVGHVVPTLFLAVGGSDVVVDVLKVQFVECSAPVGHRLGLEDG